MAAAAAPHAHPQDRLWSVLADCPIGPEASTASFERKLAHANRWTAPYARRVITEYRRYCYLAITAGHEVTPSDAVDQCWHLHLTYTRDYWDHFCPEVLGRRLHHGPSTGGEGEYQHFFEQYAATLKAYEAAFGPAPPDIWPSAAQRMGEDWRAQRVNPRDFVVLARKAVYLWLWLGGVAVMLAGLLILLRT